MALVVEDHARRSAAQCSAAHVLERLGLPQVGAVGEHVGIVALT